MSKYTFDSYERQMFENTLSKMDDDLAVMVVLSGISNKPGDLIKAFSTAVQIMALRAEGGDNEALEAGAYLFSKTDKANRE